MLKGIEMEKVPAVSALVARHSHGRLLEDTRSPMASAQSLVYPKPEDGCTSLEDSNPHNDRNAGDSSGRACHETDRVRILASVHSFPCPQAVDCLPTFTVT